jgi:predicted TIM-barrel fold metal-dependent hydrolase
MPCIVDIHTHFLRFDELSSKLCEDMSYCGILPSRWNFTEEDYRKGTAAADTVIVFGIRGKASGWLCNNENVAAFTAGGNGRYLFFASIDPAEMDYMDQLRDAHLRLGCRGVKLGPVYQGLHPHDPRYYNIYQYCQDNGLPIITHMAATFANSAPLEYARPILMDKVACDFPGLRIVLAHLGHPWEAETITVIRKQPNVYADISALYYRPWQFYNSMKLLEEYGAVGKVFFGSDFPACTTQGSIDGLRNVNSIIEDTGLPRIGQTTIDGILYNNPLEQLGIIQEASV